MIGDRLGVVGPEDVVAVAIASLQADLGRLPSVREISRFTGIARSTVHDNLPKARAVLADWQKESANEK